MNVIDFAREGAPKPIAKGDRVEIARYAWEIGDFLERATVKKIYGAQVYAITDDGLEIIAPIADCKILARAA